MFWIVMLDFENLGFCPHSEPRMPDSAWRCLRRPQQQWMILTPFQTLIVVPPYWKHQSKFKFLCSHSSILFGQLNHKHMPAQRLWFLYLLLVYSLTGRRGQNNGTSSQSRSIVTMGKVRSNTNETLLSKSTRTKDFSKHIRCNTVKLQKSNLMLDSQSRQLF